MWAYWIKLTRFVYSPDFAIGYYSKHYPLWEVFYLSKLLLEHFEMFFGSVLRHEAPRELLVHDVRVSWIRSSE